MDFGTELSELITTFVDELLTAIFEMLEEIFSSILEGFNGEPEA